MFNDLNDNMGIDWVPHPYQLSAKEFLKETGCGSLYLDPGLGKTSISLSTLLDYFEFDTRPVLVVAPLRPANEVWPREIKKWKNFAHLRYTVLHGPDKDWRFSRMMDKNIVIINYDGLQWFLKKLKGHKPFSTIIIDESSMVKSGLTKRYECLELLTNDVERIWLLTGTPASNSLMDLFSPQKLVDKGLTFGKYITQFRNKYFYQPAPFKWDLQDGAEQLIYDALAPSVLRLSSVDHLDMPELIYNDVYVELPEDAKASYGKLEAECVLQYDEGEVTAVNSAVSVMKLQQIANGGLYLDYNAADGDGLTVNNVRKTVHIHNAKTEAALEIVEDLGGQGVIIAYHFKHDLERLRKAFPSAPVLGSGLTPVGLSGLVNGWNAGKYPVLLAHAQSAGHGLNLQEFGVAVIWYNLTYSRELFDQLNARVYRQGQKAKTIVIHRIITQGTVDEDVIMALERKGATQAELFMAMVHRQKSKTI